MELQEMTNKATFIYTGPFSIEILENICPIFHARNITDKHRSLKILLGTGQIK
jgi:hypothetical protein